MVVDFLKKFRRRDNFRLDTAREVIIDGKEMIIRGYSADADYNNLTRLSVEFEPKAQFIKRNRRP
jgi:hypothetical protein